MPPYPPYLPTYLATCPTHLMSRRPVYPYQLFQTTLPTCLCLEGPRIHLTDLSTYLSTHLISAPSPPYLSERPLHPPNDPSTHPLTTPFTHLFECLEGPYTHPASPFRPTHLPTCPPTRPSNSIAGDRGSKWAIPWTGSRCLL